MRDDLDLDARLYRLGSDLVLSQEDRQALDQLRRGPDARAAMRRRSRNALRLLAVAAAVIAALGIAAVASGEGPASIILAFHPIGSGAKAGPVAGHTVPCVPEWRPAPLADLRRQVAFPILTVSASDAVLTSSRYSAPCGALVELVYTYRGESFVLDEHAGTSGPLQVNLKDYARSSWRVVTVDGRDYAVQALPLPGRSGPDEVTVAAFQQGGTRVDFTTGVKGGSTRPMSLTEFEGLVSTIG